MNKITLITAIFLGVLIIAIIYLQQKKKEKTISVAFVYAQPEHAIPSYLSSISFVSFSSFFPQLTAKGLTGATLDEYLRANGIYKITVPEDFNLTNAHSCIKLSQLDRNSGFIHTSYGIQVPLIVAKFYKDASTVLVIELDKNILATHGLILKNEQNKPGGEFFPHFHGVQQIPCAAVRASLELTKQADEKLAVSCIILYH